MKNKYAVIGGGIAGLCAAIRLCELGQEPLLIEGGSYPTHKICGEFLSSECLKYLGDWSIHPVPISRAVFKTSKSSLIFPLPSPSGGLSHIRLDPSLANYASSRGAKIITNTFVQSFTPKKHIKDVHLITLSNGEILESSNVIIATGRIPNYLKNPPSMSYMGFKAHFAHLPIQEATLAMFSLSGAYLGISPIENQQFNVACLVSLKKLRGMDPHLFIKNLISQNPYLCSVFSQGKNLFDQWMVGAIPDFGVKQTPDWLDTYFIGDAAMTIPPASGSGLSLAIMGGRLAAEYSARHQFQDFKKMWIRRCSSQIFWAKLLHKVMLNPSYSRSMIGLASYYPYIAKKIFEITRQS